MAHTTTPNSSAPSPSARQAVLAMYAGLTLTIIAAVVPVIDDATSGTLTSHLQEIYAGYVDSSTVTSSISVVMTYLFAIGALGAISWLWMIWAVKRQRRWAPIVASAIFVLGTGISVLNLVVEEYGRTLLPTFIGVTGVLPCLAGLVAVVLLWKRDPDSDST